MSGSNSIEILGKYLPEKSVTLVIDLFQKYPCHIKIVKNRKTKHGDFRRFSNGLYQITINNDLNPYRFLLTLIHELSHLVTYKKYRKVKPHGIEWKRNFQHLMLPFVSPDIYPKDILPFLAKYLLNPKASTDTDVKLSLALKHFDQKNDLNYIFEIPLEAKFRYNKKIFIRGEKRRTRYECIEVYSNKKYLFHQNAEVDLIKV